MEPNERLAALRAAIEGFKRSRRWDDALDYSVSMAQHAEALDKWMSDGGYLPDDWQRPVWTPRKGD